MAATAFVFDLDGTIWDSYPCYSAALGSALDCGSETFVERLRSGESVVTLGSGAGVSNSKLVRLCRACIGDLTLYPDVLETLNEMRAANVPLGVVTNVPQRLVIPLLSDVGINNHFGAVVCAARKPSPSGILRAAAQLNVQADERVFFVGDSWTDAGAASRAGVSFAWAAYGYGIEPPKEPTLILKTFADLLDQL